MLNISEHYENVKYKHFEISLSHIPIRMVNIEKQK